MSYSLPGGVTCGDGVVNFVNCKFYGPGTTFYPAFGYSIELIGCPTGETHKLRPVIRYSDFTYYTYAPLMVSNCNPTHEGVNDSVFWDSSKTGEGTYVYYYSTTSGISFSPDDKGSGSYGTSQYTSGYAPIPTTNIITVGSGKDYSTVEDAVAAAAHGDNIVIDAGTYTFTGLAITKCVRLYGATEDPDDVVLNELYPDSTGQNLTVVYPYRMLNVPAAYRGPGFFHITMHRNATSTYTGYWSKLCQIYRDTESYTDPLPWPYMDSMPMIFGGGLTIA